MEVINNRHGADTRKYSAYETPEAITKCANWKNKGRKYGGDALGAIAPASVATFLPPATNPQLIIHFGIAKRQHANLDALELTRSYPPKKKGAIHIGRLPEDGGKARGVTFWSVPHRTIRAPHGRCALADS